MTVSQMDTREWEDWRRRYVLVAPCGLLMLFDLGKEVPTAIYSHCTRGQLGHTDYISGGANCTVRGQCGETHPDMTD